MDTEYSPNPYHYNASEMSRFTEIKQRQIFI